MRQQVDKKQKLEAKVKEVEARTQELFDQRTKLGTTVKDLQAVLRKKKEQRTDERTRLHLKKN